MGRDKSRLAIFRKQWGRDRARCLRGVVALWSSELQALWCRGPPFLERDRGRITILQTLLKEHYLQAARSFLLSVGVRRCFAEEVPSRAFFMAARNQQRQCCLEKVSGPVGMVSDHPGILGVARDYYSDPFQIRSSVNREVDTFLGCLESNLASGEHAQLDADISSQEMEEAMLSLKIGSAPGCDGLTVEVYRAF